MTTFVAPTAMSGTGPSQSGTVSSVTSTPVSGTLPVLTSVSWRSMSSPTVTVGRVDDWVTVTSGSGQR